VTALTSDHRLAPPRLGGPMRSILNNSNAAPGVLASQQTPFHAANSAVICSTFDTDSDGESCGIRRNPTDRTIPISARVHAVADIGPDSRSELDQVGSGFVKYGARISHILKTYMSASHL
jgi:hypothetical protein